MKTYTMYWYDLDHKNHSMKFESPNDEFAKKYALNYHKENITTWAVGLSVYNNKGILIADWSKDAGRWSSNIKKKKKNEKTGTPFGL